MGLFVILTLKFFCSNWSWRLSCPLKLPSLLVNPLRRTLHILQSQVTQGHVCLERRLTASQAKLCREPQKIIFTPLLILEQLTKVAVGVLWVYLSEMIGNEMPSLCVSWVPHVGSLGVTSFLHSVH